MRGAVRLLSVCFLGAACHSTVEIPLPPIHGAGTFVFINDDLEAPTASWADYSAEGDIGGFEILLDDNVGTYALRYDCPPEQLKLPFKIGVLDNPTNFVLGANETFIFGDQASEWTAVEETPGRELSRRLDWMSPDLCEVRLGQFNYRLPPVPPSILDDLTAFFALDGERAFVAATGGAAFTIDRSGRVVSVTVPGPVRAGYRGAGDSFFLLLADGSVHEGNLDFEYRKLASGATLIGEPNNRSGWYEINQLTGSPTGEDLMVATTSASFVLEDDGSWNRLTLSSSVTVFEARWIAPGEYYIFGGYEGAEDGIYDVDRIDRFGRVLSTWEITRQPVRFVPVGDELFFATRGIAYEVVDGELEEVFETSGVFLPFGRVDDGGLLVAGVVTRPAFAALFGVHYDDAGGTCLEGPLAIESEGVLIEAVFLDANTQLFATRRLSLSGGQSPIITLRQQTSPHRQCALPALKRP